ncbi:MAG: hypothetical protein ACREQ5_11550 [Candidatus Dormibacteria bacterium]
MPKQLAEGTHGGLDLLDRSDRVAPDSEALEKTEPLNLRLSDSLDVALAEVLHAAPGGYQRNKLYYIDNAHSSRPDDIQYDRFYFTQSLLVSFFDSPMTDAQREVVTKEKTRQADFARTQGCKYLAIVGSATLEQIAQAVL